MRALVTGNDQGLGEAITNRLLDAGYEVEGIKGSVLKACKGNKWTVQEQVARCCEAGSVDVVVNNFGINHLSWIGSTPAEDQQILNTNVLVPYWVVDKLAQTQKNMKVKVVNIASQTAHVPQRCTALYCASKAALVQLTRVMARELAPNWQVNSLSPGKILGTEMTRLTDAQVLELRGWDKTDADKYAQGLIPAQRFTTKAEVTEALMQLLAMPEYVTGIDLQVMGGV
jgi:NAD(P)-dependent dehydrogenase (short-subunit alcohol dehydrogenase family)